MWSLSPNLLLTRQIIFSDSHKTFKKLLFDFCKVQGSWWLYHSPLARCSQIAEQTQIKHPGAYSQVWVIQGSEKDGKKIADKIREGQQVFQPGQPTVALSSSATQLLTVICQCSYENWKGFPFNKESRQDTGMSLPPFIWEPKCHSSCSLMLHFRSESLRILFKEVFFVFLILLFHLNRKTNNWKPEFYLQRKQLKIKNPLACHYLKL